MSGPSFNLRLNTNFEHFTGPMCRHPFDKSKIFDSSVFEPEQGEVEVSGNGDDRPAKRQKLDEVDRIFEEGTELDEVLEPSTKLKRMLETVTNALGDHPKDKTIVYSQCEGNCHPCGCSLILSSR